MNNQKRILEIFIYALLLIAGLFFYFSDIEIPSIHFGKEAMNQESEAAESPVPSEYIDYEYAFEEE